MKHKKDKINDMFLLTVLFFLFFIIGIFLTILWKRKFDFEIELISKDTIFNLTNIKWDKKMLLIQCLWKRAWIVIAFPIIALTGIGVWVLRVYISWFAFSIGILMEMLVLEFGFSGLLIFIIGIFPQYLFYIPAYYFLCQLCIRINRKKRLAYPYQYNSQNNPNTSFLKQILLIFGVVITGAMFESYVNPIILKNFLKIFI